MLFVKKVFTFLCHPSSSFRWCVISRFILYPYYAFCLKMFICLIFYIPYWCIYCVEMTLVNNWVFSVFTSFTKFKSSVMTVSIDWNISNSSFLPCVSAYTYKFINKCFIHVNCFYASILTDNTATSFSPIFIVPSFSTLIFKYPTTLSSWIMSNSKMLKKIDHFQKNLRQKI